jgi:chromosome segregation ATPase
MVTFLKGRRSTDGDAMIALEQANRANAAAALDPLVVRAEAAAEQLRSLSSLLDRATEVEALKERCAAAEERVVALEALAARFTTAEERANRIEQLGQEMGPLSEKADAALRLHDQIQQFMGNESLIAQLREETDGVREQLTELTENVGRMRGQADDALRAHRHATSRLEAFDQDNQAATGRLEDVERRVQTVERALEPVNQAVTAVPDLQHRLAVLQSLAEQVAQKSGLLEQQREAVERASTQISQLTRLDRELDAWLRRQEEQIRRFGAIETKIQEVQAIQTKVISRSEELQATSLQNEHTYQAAKQALSDLREQMRKSSEGFELENRGLHAVSERVADLRNAVKECESRFAVLDAASQGAAAVQAQVRALNDHSTQLSVELVRLAEETTRLTAFRQDVERIGAVTEEVTGRMERIYQLKPDVDEAVQHLVALKGTHELVADGLERMRDAYEEMSRLRESHAESHSRLTAADAFVRKVESQVKDLSEMEPEVARIRSEIEQVKESMSEIAARRETVEELRQQVSDVANTGDELVDRMKGLESRVEGAEARFVQLAKKSDEADKVAYTMAEVAESVAEADRKITAVDTSVRALESRTSQLDEIEGRIRMLGQELEQRRGALEKASEHLTHATQLRKQSAETAHRLEEVSQAITTALAEAEQRSDKLSRTAGDLESRAAALKAIERPVAHFEELLGNWESAQEEAARALEQTLARQAAVDALEAQVKHVFELAERAVADVQIIGSSRHAIEETRSLLESTQEQFKVTEAALEDFATRKRQLERAEQRLARAEALALGMRSTVEALTAQRTVVDHAMESASSLAMQMKQAEGLIAALRKERTLACELKAALDLEEEDEEPRK